MLVEQKNDCYYTGAGLQGSVALAPHQLPIAVIAGVNRLLDALGSYAENAGEAPARSPPISPETHNNFAEEAGLTCENRLSSVGKRETLKNCHFRSILHFHRCLSFLGRHLDPA